MTDNEVSKCYVVTFRSGDFSLSTEVWAQSEGEASHIATIWISGILKRSVSFCFANIAVKPDEELKSEEYSEERRKIMRGLFSKRISLNRPGINDGEIFVCFTIRGNELPNEKEFKAWNTARIAPTQKNGRGHDVFVKLSEFYAAGFTDEDIYKD